MEHLEKVKVLSNDHLKQTDINSECENSNVPEFLVDVLFVEAQFVEHANEESILLFGIVLALICSVRDAQLVEWRTIPTEKNPYTKTK